MPVYTNHMYPGWMGRPFASSVLYLDAFDAPGCGMFWFKDPQFKPDNPRNVFHVELTGAKAQAMLRSIWEKKRFEVDVMSRVRISHRPDDVEIVEMRHDASGEFLDFQFGRFREDFGQDTHELQRLEGLNDIPPARVCGRAFRYQFDSAYGPDPAEIITITTPSLFPAVGMFGDRLGAFDNISDSLTLTKDSVNHANVNYLFKFEHISGPTPPETNPYLGYAVEESSVRFQPVGVWMEAADHIHVYMRVDCSFSPYDYGYIVSLFNRDNTNGNVPDLNDPSYAEQVNFSVFGQTVTGWLEHQRYSVFDESGGYYEEGTRLLDFDLSYDLNVTEWWD